MARQLVESLAAKGFEPEKYHDQYREQLLDLIDRKAVGRGHRGRAADRGAGQGARPRRRARSVDRQVEDREGAPPEPVEDRGEGDGNGEAASKSAAKATKAPAKKTRAKKSAGSCYAAASCSTASQPQPAHTGEAAVSALKFGHGSQPLRTSSIARAVTFVRDRRCRCAWGHCAPGCDTNGASQTHTPCGSPTHRPLTRADTQIALAGDLDAAAVPPLAQHEVVALERGVVPRRRSPSACRRSRSSPGSCFTRRSPSAIPARVRCSAAGDRLAEQAADVVRRAADRSARGTRGPLAQRGAHAGCRRRSCRGTPSPRSRRASRDARSRTSAPSWRAPVRPSPSARARERRPRATRHRARGRRARRDCRSRNRASSVVGVLGQRRDARGARDLEPEAGPRGFEALGVAATDRRLVEHHRGAPQARARPCAPRAPAAPLRASRPGSGTSTATGCVRRRCS